MSQYLAYFPPQGTKYKWHPKALNYSPWSCRMWEHWPASIIARVEKSETGVFLWSVEVRNFSHDRRLLRGKAADGLSACLEAERACETEKGLLWLPWIEQAVAAGWRPPS